MKLLLTGAVSWSEEQINEIRNLGNEILYIQDERIPLSEQDVDVACIEGVVCNGLFLYNNIADFKNLKYIQLTSAGFDRVPMDYINEHNIEIHNARGVYSIPMAEFAISGVLQLYKRSRFFCENQRSRVWKKHRNVRELYDKIVCVIGCGSVGTECAKRFKAFGCHVTGVDLYPRADENFDKMVSLEDFETVLNRSDVVVLALPLTDKTRHLMNESKLRGLKQGVVLINIARGAVLDTEAFINILPDLGGAVLDVFEEEPLPEDSPLWGMDNVVITPHNSFVGEGNRERLQRVVIENIKKQGVHRA